MSYVKPNKEERMAIMRNADVMHFLRTLFENKDHIEAVAYDFAVEAIQPKGPIYVTVESVGLDDSHDEHHTVCIHARENWQGNCEDHTIVVPLEDFADAFAKAVDWPK